MYAEDMYVNGHKLPRDEPRIQQAGWEVVAYITARDSILPPGAQMEMSNNVVLYGFLARKTDDHNAYVAAVRGTQASSSGSSMPSLSLSLIAMCPTRRWNKDSGVFMTA